MAFLVDTETGNITLVQGDSGKLVVDGLPTYKAFTVYFGIYNSNRQSVGEQIAVNANQSPMVIFSVTASLTDLLTVPKKDETAEYYYGIKICDSITGEEDTLIVADGNIGDLNTITVYPKKVEGLS